MRDFTWPENGPIGRKRFRLFAKRGRYAISLILEIATDGRPRLTGKRTIGRETISRIWKTLPMRDFANFGHRGRCAISLGRDTEPLTGQRFRLFGKHVRCAISLISEIMAGSRFQLARKRGHWPVAMALICKTWAVRDFANFGNRDLRAISLVRETEPVVGKRFRLFWGTCRFSISLMLDIMGDARFRLTGNGTIGQKTISRIRETPYARFR